MEEKRNKSPPSPSLLVELRDASFQSRPIPDAAAHFKETLILVV